MHQIVKTQVQKDAMLLELGVHIVDSMVAYREELDEDEREAWSLAMVELGRVFPQMTELAAIYEGKGIARTLATIRPDLN